MQTNWVYLVHLDTPIHHAGHYLGSAIDPYQRLDLHRAGQGERLLQVAVERGIEFKIVRLWEGGRQLERQLKNQKCAPTLCPLCRNSRNAQRWQLSFLDEMLLSFTLADVPEMGF